MPVQLADRSRIDLLESRGERVVDRKFLYGDDPICSSGELRRPLLTQPCTYVQVGMAACRPSDTAGGSRGDLAAQNVGFLLGQRVAAEFCSFGLMTVVRTLPVVRTPTPRDCVPV